MKITFSVSLDVGTGDISHEIHSCDNGTTSGDRDIEFFQTGWRNEHITSRFSTLCARFIRELRISVRKINTTYPEAS